MRSGTWRLRWGLLLLVAAVGVHAGRYAAASGQHHDAAAHGYLSLLIPALLAASLLAVIEIVGVGIRLARRGDHVELPCPSTRPLWVRSFALLLAVFVIQESGEALVAGGHAHGSFALLGPGAWAVIPLAAGAAALVALALRGAAAALSWAAASRRHAPRRKPVSLRLRPLRVLPRIASGVCRSLAPRGPPRVVAL